MIQDYSRRYSTVGRSQKVCRHRRVTGGADSGLLWKAVGVLASFAVVVGVAASLWLGWQIDSGLDELGSVHQVRQELTVQSKNLLAKRDTLRSRKQIEAAAVTLGLYPPTSRQVRRP